MKPAKGTFVDVAKLKGVEACSREETNSRWLFDWEWIFFRGKEPTFPSCFFGCGGVHWSNEACKGDFCGCCLSQSLGG